MELVDWPTGLAIYGAALSTLLLVLRIVELRANRADLRLTIGTGVVMGGMGTHSGPITSSRSPPRIEAALRSAYQASDCH
jgi:hypothetical protein